MAQIFSFSGLFNQYRLGNTNSGTAQLPFAKDAWHQSRIELDFQNAIMYGSVDGQSLGSLSINNAVLPTTITRIGLYTTGTGGTTQDVYFDNHSLTVVPEPSSLAIWWIAAVGAVLAGSRRRFVRS